MAIAGQTTDAIARDPAFVRAHQSLVADKTIQFDLPTLTQPKPPPWAEAIAAFFRWLAPAFEYLFWGAVAVIVLMVLWLVVRRMQGASFRWPWQRRAAPKDEAPWTPDTAQARTLLSEAEALAAQGRYGEAARLLLRRSVEDIDTRRPGFLKPSITAREIAEAPAVPLAARSAFAAIARVVEASAFGSARVTAEAWETCRKAYADFAIAGAWRG